MERGNPKRIRSKRTAGQAVIEYMLMILVALSVAGLLGFGFRKIFFKVWMQMACEVTAPCPHCAAPAPIKAVANRMAAKSCR
jgi:hypothetical protein